MVTRHNRLRDEVFDLCRRAHLSVSVERGHGLTSVLPNTRPADALIAGWDRGKSAALDLSITSPPCSAILSESCHQAGAAALAAEACKLHSNGPKCQELGWAGPASHGSGDIWQSGQAGPSYLFQLASFTRPPPNQLLWLKFMAG